MRFLAIAALAAATAAQQLRMPMTGSSSYGVPFEFTVKVQDETRNFSLTIVPNTPLIDTVSNFVEANQLRAAVVPPILRYVETQHDQLLGEAIQSPATSPIVKSYFTATFGDGVSARALQFSNETPEAAALRFAQDRNRASSPDVDLELRTFVRAFIDNSKTPFSQQELESMRATGQYPPTGNASVAIGTTQLTVAGQTMRLFAMPGETASAAVVGFLSRNGLTARVPEPQVLELLTRLAASIDETLIYATLTLDDKSTVRVAGTSDCALPARAVRIALEAIDRLGLPLGTNQTLVSQLGTALFNAAREAQTITGRRWNVEERLAEVEKEDAAADAEAAEAEAAEAAERAAASLIAAAPFDRSVEITLQGQVIGTLPVVAGEPLKEVAEGVCAQGAQDNSVLFRAYLNQALARRNGRHTASVREAAYGMCARAMHAVLSSEFIGLEQLQQQQAAA